MSKKIELGQGKVKNFKVSAPVEVLSQDPGGDPDGQENKNDFQIVGYTGQVVKRWWGRLAVVVDGIEAMARLPIFRDHNRQAIVGFSNETWKENGNFMLAGVFSKITEAAREAKALAAEGFPWQASIGVEPLEIVQVEGGETYELDGEQIAGPAEIWTRSKVFETSFLPLGADDQTSVAVFSAFDEEQAPPDQPGSGADNNHLNRSENMEFTLEILQEKAPDLLASIQDAARKEGLTEGLAQGAEQERDRIKAVRAQLMAGHEDLVESLMFDGTTTGDQAAVQILAAEKKIRNQAAAHLKADGIDPVETVEPAAPAKKAANGILTKEQFEADAGLVEKFDSDWEAFDAYQQARSKGQCRIFGQD